MFSFFLKFWKKFLINFGACADTHCFALSRGHDAQNFDDFQALVLPRRAHLHRRILRNDLAAIEMMGLIGMGNNPIVGATVAVAVAVEEAMRSKKFERVVPIKKWAEKTLIY